MRLAWLLLQPSLAEPWILQQLRGWQLEDFDCSQSRGGVADWRALQQSAAEFNAAWSLRSPPPLKLCPRRKASSARRWSGNLGLALASDECPLGALTAQVIGLICSSDCHGGTTDFQRLMSEALLPSTQEIFGVPSSRGSLWLLSTAWPTAELLAKWSANCTRRPGRRFQARCANPGLTTFTSQLHAAADATLAQLLAGPVSLIFDARLDHFATAGLEILRLQDGRAKLKNCGVELATKDMLLLFLRLLGPPVPGTDPLAPAAAAAAAARAAQLEPPELLRAWPLLAMLAAVRLTTWRSHGLYPHSQVPIPELQDVLQLSDRVDGSQAGVGMVEAKQPAENGRLQQIVAGALPLSPVWQRVASWLLAAPDAPSVVFMTMLWGSLGDDTWARRFLARALHLGLPRFIFMSPDEALLLDCEDVAAKWRKSDSYPRLLCMRSFSKFRRPYDVNNYAKFVLVPLLLALGMSYAWLDIDIFLVQNPTQRLQEIAALQEADVLTTDHFDQNCLNHGVIFVKPSDRTLYWILSYIRWMHVNPFGHDQNGWDAFLGHSIQFEPFVPAAPLANVTLAVLDTSKEFLTLTGWAGDDTELPKVRGQGMIVHSQWRCLGDVVALEDGDRIAVCCHNKSGLRDRAPLLAWEVRFSRGYLEPTPAEPRLIPLHRPVAPLPLDGAIALTAAPSFGAQPAPLAEQRKSAAATVQWQTDQLIFQPQSAVCYLNEREASGDWALRHGDVITICEGKIGPRSGFWVVDLGEAPAELRPLATPARARAHAGPDSLTMTVPETLMAASVLNRTLEEVATPVSEDPSQTLELPGIWLQEDASPWSTASARQECHAAQSPEASGLEESLGDRPDLMVEATPRPDIEETQSATSSRWRSAAKRQRLEAPSMPLEFSPEISFEAVEI
ncbi:unnamed protein product [Effrenium voratum]|nr:unnamed protein product [Effrenium voratum]